MFRSLRPRPDWPGPTHGPRVRPGYARAAEAPGAHDQRSACQATPSARPTHRLGLPCGHLHPSPPRRARARDKPPRPQPTRCRDPDNTGTARLWLPIALDRRGHHGRASAPTSPRTATAFTDTGVTVGMENRSPAARCEAAPRAQVPPTRRHDRHGQPANADAGNNNDLVSATTQSMARPPTIHARTPRHQPSSAGKPPARCPAPIDDIEIRHRSTSMSAHMPSTR